MDIDLQKIQEAYGAMITPITEDSEMAIASGPYVREARPQEKSNIDKAIHVDDTNVTHEYSDQELHQMCIVALKDLVDRMYPDDQARILPKVDWLISMLQKRARG